MFTLLALAALAGDIHQPMDSGLGCETCHTERGLTEGRFFVDNLTRSELCLSCHDGGLGPDAAPVMNMGGGTGTGEHPVTVAYEGADLEDPEAVAEAGLRLVSHGSARYVECISCHDPHPNGREAMIRGERGKLCEGCHEM